MLTMSYGRAPDGGVMENEPPPGVQDPGPFYHGTKADLRPGDVIEPGIPPTLANRIG